MGISLESNLNVFICFKAYKSTILIYFDNSTIFVYFSWHPLCLWICYGVRSVHFTVSTGRKGTLFFLHIELHNHQNNLNRCLWLYYYGKVIAELEKKHKQQKINKLFIVLVIWPSCTLKFLYLCFWFQIMSEQSFPSGTINKLL